MPKRDIWTTGYLAIVGLSVTGFLLWTVSAYASDLPIPDTRPTSPEIPFAPLKPANPLPRSLVERDITCEKRLADRGVRFRVLAAENGKGKCGISFPIAIDQLPGAINVEPETKLECRVAEALADWVAESVRPAVGVFEDDRKLTALVNASTYACRGRNNQFGAKLSEHAKGNAIDISSFIFDNGVELPAMPRDRQGSDEEAFQKAVRFGACLHFTTVLGPGSDAFHDDHLHLDVALRRGGFRLCRFPAAN